MRKLTIGMATYDDYDGVYFSIQSIRMFHPEILPEIEFVIIDNNPTGGHSKSIRNLMNWINEPVQYLPFTKYQSTSIKNKIFDLADTPYVLCMDCHVMFEPGSLKKLIDFFDSGKDQNNLLQGPLVYDDLKNISTHFDLNVWRSYMWGTWATDPRGLDESLESFEIPAQGLGAFACRKNAWLRFNPHFKGFGGEEGYIHEKYRQHGKTTLCLPFLRWLHRFDRPLGVPYPNVLRDRFRNYYIGHLELGLDLKNLLSHFSEFNKPEILTEIENEILIKYP